MKKQLRIEQAKKSRNGAGESGGVGPVEAARSFVSDAGDALHPRTKRWILAALFIFLALFLPLTFLGKAGVAGSTFASILETAFGFGRFFLVGFFFALGIWLLRASAPTSRVTFWGALLGFCALLALLAIFDNEDVADGLGGKVGYWISYFVVMMFGKTVAALFFSALIAVGLFLLFNFPGEANFARIKTPESFKVRGGPASEMKIMSSTIEIPSGFVGKPLSYARHAVGAGAESPSYTRGDLGISLKSDRAAPRWQMPSSDLLDEETGRPQSGDIKANANIIKRTLANFGIDVEMGEVHIGPTVTQYTLKPAEGMKLSRITALANDISLSLAAHPIRIEAPIPGRALVGIEIPNKASMFVRLKPLFEEEHFRFATSQLVIALGRDVAGEPAYAALEKMPHLLIAGSTGSGKTIALNSLILSLLWRNPPAFLRLLLIDPKRVEFPIYNEIPHLLTPVIVDVQKTINALRWAVGEMDRRFDVLAAARARDIAMYNRELRAGEESMPYIVIVIDELADLMAARGREVEAAVVRLAQMARAVGIHLVVATQRPSVEVITGLIKANITSRIAFQVASQIDSRTILDGAGAEKLLGKGDMLFLSAETAKPRRLQGAYVSEKEVKRVADFLRKSAAEPLSYHEEILEFHSAAEGGVDGEGDFYGESDPLYEEAKRLVIQARKASASYLQRRLRVGYARAARLIDLLEQNGVVGPGEGAKPRDILMAGAGGSQEVDLEKEEEA